MVAEDRPSELEQSAARTRGERAKYAVWRPYEMGVIWTHLGRSATTGETRRWIYFGNPDRVSCDRLVHDVFEEYVRKTPVAVDNGPSIILSAASPRQRGVRARSSAWYFQPRLRPIGQGSCNEDERTARRHSRCRLSSGRRVHWFHISSTTTINSRGNGLPVLHNS